MIYLPELYYLQDQEDFPLPTAVLVTAQGVSQWCQYYYAELIAAPKGIDERRRQGTLPGNQEERNRLVADLVNWIFQNSEVEELFALFFDPEPLPQRRSVVKFDHHDDTDCWALNLNESEYAQLRQIWQAHGLPPDLFYPETEGIHVPYEGTSTVGKLLQKLGGQGYYTPKQWQARR